MSNKLPSLTLADAVGIEKRDESRALAMLRDDVAALTLTVQDLKIESQHRQRHLDTLMARIKKLEDGRNG